MDSFDAALLFSDISGFTALTERLQARGREGAEEISAVVSAAFRPAIEAIERRGGSIVSFGGDSLFTVFTGTGRVRSALGAAEEIRSTFARRGAARTSAGPVSLGVSQAIHDGAVVGLHLGSERERHYLLCGRSVAAVARLESRAVAGQVRLSGPAAARLSREARPGRRPPASRVAHAGRIRSYLPRPLWPLLGNFDGEYRNAALLFLETRGARPSSLLAFHRALASLLARYDGLLLKTDLSKSGTKWLCVFGIPSSHEDDARRACRVGFDLLAVRRSCAVRGAIHAGTLVNLEVGSRKRRSFDVMGDVVNSAARAMAIASWGEILVTEGARQRARGIQATPRGRHNVKGKAEPLTLHALCGVESIEAEALPASTMVGRAKERARIELALAGAREGRGSTLGVCGEPGMGKSRLLAAAAESATAMGMKVHAGRAAPFGARPYGAIGALVRACLGIAEDDPGPHWDRLRSAAIRHGIDDVDRQHLADVIGVREPRSILEHLDGRSIRQNAMVAIRGLCIALARESPRLLVLEDMHWADELTREAATWIAAAAGDCRIVLLLAYRPEHEPPREADVIHLGPLPDEDASALVGALAQGLPAAASDLVIERAGGNPFYVEEVLSHLSESGVLIPGQSGWQLARFPADDDVPERIESIIRARLDALPLSAKDAAQCGAVLGRRFSLDVLAQLAAASRARASREGVGELRRRDIVRPVLEGARPELAFKHALTRDVAYGSILVARRRKIHHAAATALAAADELGRPRAAALGRHWELGGEPARARPCYLFAAREAAARHANEEAEGAFRDYLRVAEPRSAEAVAARHELGRLLKLVGRIPEADEEHRHGIEDARAIRDAEGEAEGLYRRAALLAEDDAADALYAGALAIWERTGNLSGQARVHKDRGWVAMTKGRGHEARALFDRGLSAARAAADRRIESIVLDHQAGLAAESGDHGTALALAGHALAIQKELGDLCQQGIILGGIGNVAHRRGRFDEAVPAYEEALAIARRVGDRRRIGILLSNLATIAHDRGDVSGARRALEEALDIARLVRERSFEGSVLVNLAIVERQAGNPSRAALLLEHAVTLQQQAGNPRAEIAARVQYARVLAEMGRNADALALAEKTLEVVSRTSSATEHAAVEELLGDMRLMKGDPRSAAPLFASALARRRALGQRNQEAANLRRLAELARYLGGDLAAAARDLVLATEIVGVGGNPSELVRIACAAGHVALAAGGDGEVEMVSADRHLSDLGPGTSGELGELVSRLRRAVAARREGCALICGDRPADVAFELARWLLEERPHEIPEEIAIVWRSGS
ncbi:MAG: tetratricopeptide repeat protein [Acidobacteriota bacterium]